MVPLDRRRIVTTDFGLRVYVDPLNFLGLDVLRTGTYEPETVEIFRSEIQRGDVVIDVGANEGVFTALAGVLTGNEGLVVAVEPQSRLRDLLEINLCLNDVKNYRAFQYALGSADGSEGKLNLFPTVNTGMSSLVRRSRFLWTRLGSAVEKCSFISPERILRECNIDRVDFMKVDVEGFEHHVVEALLPIVKNGTLRKLYLDYHMSILAKQGINPSDIHQRLVEHGMEIKRGDARNLSSYVLYERCRAFGD
jgi:FkbM family methyltransferase